MKENEFYEVGEEVIEAEGEEVEQTKVGEGKRKEITDEKGKKREATDDDEEEVSENEEETGKGHDDEIEESNEVEGDEGKGDGEGFQFVNDNTNYDSDEYFLSQKPSLRKKYKNY